MPHPIDRVLAEALLEIATPAEARYLTAVIEHGSNQKAAKALGADRRTVDQAIARARLRGTRQGIAPDHDLTHPVPDGYHLRGASTLYTRDAETGKDRVAVQWVKTEADKDARMRLLFDALEGLISDASRFPKVKAPKRVAADLMVVYPMGDPHLGMYAWAEESGDDFDLAIGERNLVNATRQLVESAPASDQALIVNLGDFFHSDTTQNRTLKSGNVLDIDTRWSKVLRAGLRAMRACIDAALARHQTVRVINEIGNHDEHTSQVLTLALQALYENNDRVSFDDSPARFHYLRFGKTLLGITHGDNVKPEQLGPIMATDRPQEWGATLFRYWLTGHIHVKRVFEHPGCTVESFRTLAPKDAWTAGSGYRAGRDMHAIVLHKEYGEIGRHRVDIVMLEK